MSSYLRNKDLSSRTRKPVLESPPSSPSSGNKSFRRHRLTVGIPLHLSGGAAAVHGWSPTGTLLCINKHDRLSRGDASEVESASETQGHTSYYTRRELDSLNKTTDSPSKDFKKLYEEALAENEKLKACLEDSKQDLAKFRLQLDKVTKKQDRIPERSSVFDSEKMEKQVLEKRVSEMEEELKVLTELKSDNQRLKDENGALIRVISKLSK
ncbi:protein phosphatase 1 regulatory subunit 12A isoform X2 [Pangasianodon hypophthalmus]|nr:protein phosphatase 1 regulatory subunit 12A isoform X2 [Pangasianodon hypophthalmus]XP_053096707.1 protein phosphatase 1 regulatory subunit 12A isoform X2 [Pangasianodon hypophthalmus]